MHLLDRAPRSSTCELYACLNTHTCPSTSWALHLTHACRMVGKGEPLGSPPRADAWGPGAPDYHSWVGEPWSPALAPDTVLEVGRGSEVKPTHGPSPQLRLPPPAPLLHSCLHKMTCQGLFMGRVATEQPQLCSSTHEAMLHVAALASPALSNANKHRWQGGELLSREA